MNVRGRPDALEWAGGRPEGWSLKCACAAHARAQITLEALLVAAVGLSLLLIAAGALQRLGDAQEGARDSLALSAGAQALANSADEICALGAGNSRIVPLPVGGIFISADSYGVNASRGRLFAVRPCLCPLEVRAGDFGHEAFLWHEDSHVVISPNPPG
jgi:hypothetical protein